MYILLFIFLVIKTDYGKTQTILDNAIIGQPYISCERDRIVVEVVTERSFTGKIFVKGDYANPTCSRLFKNGLISTRPDENDAAAIQQPFPGTITRSKEPYDVAGVTETTTSSTSTSTSDEEQREFPIAEGHIIPSENKTGKWTGVGGASSGLRAAFGGSRGEEKIQGFRIFERPSEGQLKATEKESSLGSSWAKKQEKEKENCLPTTTTTTTCAPCKCDERRSRRATNSIRLEVPLDSCNSKRDRKLNPPSVVVSFVAIVSFHDSFITKLDKAYHIQCAYAEAEKIVSTDLDVGMIEDTELSVTTDAPTCDYLITDEKGHAVKNGLVGELINHKWSCGGGMSQKLKILVHDCFVKDGGGQQYQVIDENGCTLDQIMLQTPTYSEDGLSAQVDAYIFKFPDRSTLDFRCSITFCSIDDNECHTMTPPKCDVNSSQFLRKRRSVNVRNSLSLHANSLTVFDMSMEPKTTEFTMPTPQSLLSIDEISTNFCISVASFGILISASTFFATISFAIIFSYIFLRFNQKFICD